MKTKMPSYKRVSSYLIANPWCTTAHISAVLGISERTVRRVVSTASAFESIKIPVGTRMTGNQKHRVQKVYAPSLSTQLEVSGLKMK